MKYILVSFENASRKFKLFKFDYNVTRIPVALREDLRNLRQYLAEFSE
jgi:hypothetical protein